MSNTQVHLSVADACARHNCSRAFLYRLIGGGKVSAVKNGRRTLIVARTLDDHFASLPPARIKAPKGASENDAFASSSERQRAEQPTIAPTR
jgi:excisionase family DNA binding protein